MSARAGSALVAASLLLGTYILPAYADAYPDLPTASPAAPSGTVQTLTVPTDPTPSVAQDIRDKFDITKALPALPAGAAPYSRIADTFTNNPGSPVQWPFLVGAPISSWFGWREPPCGGCSAWHKGIDINPGDGTPIQAIADGIVTEVGADQWDYGTYVIITHQIGGQVIASRYAHMIEGSVPLVVGDAVNVGQFVGQVGNTGMSTGAHLHFEILLGGITPTDPYAWLKAQVVS